MFSGVTRCLLAAVAAYCETQIIRSRVTNFDLNYFLRASRPDLDGIGLAAKQQSIRDETNLPYGRLPPNEWPDNRYEYEEFNQCASLVR
jgi:hypothetical protein